MYNLVNDGWSNSVEICCAFCGIAEWVMTPVALSFSSGDSLISLGLTVSYYQSQQVELFDESKRTGRGVKGWGVFNEHSIKKPSSRHSVWLLCPFCHLSLLLVPLCGYIVSKKFTVYCSCRPFSTTPKGLCQGEEHGCEQERFRRDHEIKETCERWGPGECEHFLKCLYILLLTHTLKPRGICYLYIATEKCI